VQIIRRLLRRQPIEDSELPLAPQGGLPESCFISHSYRDAGEVEQLEAQLAGKTSPVIFPPITVAQLERISDRLISTIASCDGLIYLTGGHSARSFWVAFERDYALRLGKKVYGYDPQTGQLTLDTSPPLDLRVFCAYDKVDIDRVRSILDFMKDQRHFAVWFDLYEIPDAAEVRPSFHDAHAGSWEGKIYDGITATVRRGGYVLAFWSRGSAGSPWLFGELDAFLRFSRDTGTEGGVIHVVLDDVIGKIAEEEKSKPYSYIEHALENLPGVHFGRGLDAYPSSIEYISAKNREWGGEERSPDKTSPLLIHQVFDEAGELDPHKVDSLIVHLYWLMYRNSAHGELDVVDKVCRHAGNWLLPRGATVRSKACRRILRDMAAGGPMPDPAPKLLSSLCVRDASYLHSPGRVRVVRYRRGVARRLRVTSGSQRCSVSRAPT